MSNTSLQYINTYALLNGRVLNEKEATGLKDEISKGSIKKADPYAAEIKVIRAQLIKLVNTYKGKPDGFTILVTIETPRLQHYNKILQASGLGFLPLIIGAAAGRLMEHHVSKLFSKKKTQGVNGIVETGAEKQIKKELKKHGLKMPHGYDIQKRKTKKNANKTSEDRLSGGEFFTEEVIEKLKDFKPVKTDDIAIVPYISEDYGYTLNFKDSNKKVYSTKEISGKGSKEQTFEALIVELKKYGFIDRLPDESEILTPFNLESLREWKPVKKRAIQIIPTEIGDYYRYIMVFSDSNSTTYSCGVTDNSKSRALAYQSLIKELKRLNFVPESLSGPDKGKCELLKKLTNTSLGVMSIKEAKNKHYELIGLQGGWKELIGDACEPTTIFPYGPGGSGKSTLALGLSYYLASKLNKKVDYVAGEQYDSPDFKLLLNRLNLVDTPNFRILESLDKVDPSAQWVAIDSKDSLKYTIEQFRADKKKGRSYIVTSQGTKAGEFRGTEEWRNESNTLIYCEDMIADTTSDKNRWGGKAKMDIIKLSTNI